MLSQSVEQVLRLLGLWYAWTIVVDTGVVKLHQEGNSRKRSGGARYPSSAVLYSMTVEGCSRSPNQSTRYIMNVKVEIMQLEG